MKHKVKVMFESEKRGLFGKKKVMEPRTVWVDSKTYKEMQKKKRKQPFSLDEMMLYDWIFEEWDD